MNYLTDYLSDILENKNIDISDVRLEKSRDGRNIFRVKCNEKFRYIGSKYNAEKDIENFMSKFKDIKIDTLLIVFGMGTGEHILDLIKILKEFNKVLIVEPDKRILKRFLSLEYSALILEDKRISIIDFNYKYIRKWLIDFIEDESNFNNVKFICYANYERIYPEEYLKFLSLLKNVLVMFESNVSTGYALGRNFMNCYLHNIKYITSSYIINDLKNKFKGFTAIVVSAGSSLEKNIEELKKINDNVVIICGNRTLKPLLDRGIIPHFMCAVDCSDTIYDMCRNYMERKVPLVFSETTSSKLVSNQKGDRIFARYPSTGTDIEKILGKEVDSLYSGGSVAHFSMDFAKYIGCNTIAFIGQDLAYTYDKAHADITEIYEDKKEFNVDELIQVEGIKHNKVFTTRALDRFRDAFEEYIGLNNNIKFVNCSENGANIKGTEINTVEELLDKYAIRSGVNAVYRDLFKNKPAIDKMGVSKNIKNILKKLVCTNKRIKNIRKLITITLAKNEINDIDCVYEKISELNDEIGKNKLLNFIDFLISNVMNRSVTYFRYEQSEDNDENFRNILKAFTKLYMDIIETIEYILPKIEKCVKNL